MSHAHSKIQEALPRRAHAIERHLARTVAPVAFVAHELTSELVHVDVHFVPPSSATPFWLLFTTGMSDLPMTVPCECCPTHAELCMLLPPSWQCDRSAWTDDRWFWPIRWLRDLARLPHRRRTWIDQGHTIPNGDPPRPFNRSTKLAGMIVLRSITLPVSAQTISTNGIDIELFTLWPIHRDEMRFKLARGAEALVDRLEEAAVSDIVDPDRPSVLAARRSHAV